MNRLLLIPAVLALLAFAPAPRPKVKVETDPDRALAQFEKDLHDRANHAVLKARKKQLVALLEKHEAELRKRGKSALADALRDRLALLAAIDVNRPLGKTTSGELLGKAAAQGKYRKLLRVLHMPADQANYGTFREFGHWNGTAYNGEVNLPSGYWVYVQPRWFIWGEMTTP
jgi:hypothetical protein